MKKILVINPNSNQRVTDGFARALAPFDIGGTLQITCGTLEEGPFGIETDEHIRQVVAPLKRAILAQGGYDAYVIACYSDPGLDACRALTRAPVLGIQLSALAVARSLDRKFGVLAIGQPSIRRHLAYIEELGLGGQLAAERPLGISVEQAAGDASVFETLEQTGRLLVERDGAQVVILGCAGLAAHRLALEQALGVPVIEPVQAAVSIAMSCVLPLKH